MDGVEQMLLGMARDPALFVEEVIGAKPTREQRELLRAIARPDARVAARSGHNVGKTATLSWVVLWALSLLTPVTIPCIATKRDQLRFVLWPEISKWKAKMHPHFRRRIEITAERISIFGRERECFAVPVTARPEDPEALQGFHADNLILLMDEASGISNTHYDSARSSLATPGSRCLAVSNPTRADGWFFEAFHKHRESWTTIHFSAKGSELANPQYEAELRRDYGVDSQIYIVRVLGDFPPESPDVLIPLAWLEAADGREVFSPAADVVGGVDVARFGDDTTAYVLRRGVEVFDAEQWGGNDTMQSTGRIAAKHFDRKVARWNVDTIGVGAGVADRLMELEIPTAGINVSETPAASEKFNKLRDELWWKAREFYQDRNSRLDPKLPFKELLMAQLSTVRYGFLSNGKIKVEGKEEMKERGVSSPNLADAHNNTFAQGVRAQTRRSLSAPVRVVTGSERVAW